MCAQMAKIMDNVIQMIPANKVGLKVINMDMMIYQSSLASYLGLHLLIYKLGWFICGLWRSKFELMRLSCSQQAIVGVIIINIHIMNYHNNVVGLFGLKHSISNFDILHVSEIVKFELTSFRPF